MSALAAVALSALVAPTAASAGPARTTSTPTTVAPAPKTYSYSFAGTAQGWQADFADYSPEQGEESMELKSGIAPLPAGTEHGNGFFIQGHNRSDDLFMFFKKRLGPADGILPGQRYSVQSSVSFWSKEPTGCLGSGGSAGGSVHVKAGASTAEPRVYLDAANHYRVTLGKGQQKNGGPESAYLGNIENGQECGQAKKWTKVTRTSPSHTALTVQADAQGYLWLNAGTDSGYEGLTQLYYSNITTTLTPRSG
ncbi:hypothetical protein EDD30_4892 [Couchioplanes caeruleus]|uniref:Uncharacterized protein n=3 Tax=Couchioplanes caeruleus TaxID=56438 RepID=A0A1K0FAA0_9ACTN|nr:hypothetical protein BG844_36480 [Couchioplanes caeruleus subsp. caeruleus]ROP31964.1 hypothetical protein EDD30_4892 [Couchioplanes caeruleus]